MSKAQQCKKEANKCKCSNMCRCGTGDTGCTEPPMNHMSSSMCNGVFKPVCAPEVCNVPRIPHQETLVEGKGILLDTDSRQGIDFNIFVEREMQVYRGSLELKGLKCDGIGVKAGRLKFFESDGMTHMQAIFYEESTGRNIMVTVYKGEEEEEEKEEEAEEKEEKEKGKGKKGCQGHEQEITQLFIYSAPIGAEPINLGGKVVGGKIELYADHNVHEH